jgi:hypothetical protein
MKSQYRNVSAVFFAEKVFYLTGFSLLSQNTFFFIKSLSGSEEDALLLAECYYASSQHRHLIRLLTENGLKVSTFLLKF